MFFCLLRESRVHKLGAPLFVKHKRVYVPV
nr:MAG TPA: hypothetical protein [Caudoviricetes sp.]